jgi:hypothetical protein
MKKEIMNKQSVQNTYTTMKEVLRDPRYLQAVEIISKNEHNWDIHFQGALKNEE